MRGQQIFFVCEQLLVQLLSWPETSVVNFYILPLYQTRQANHVHRQICYFHGLPHVKDKDLSAGAYGAGLQDQLAGLWNGHKVTGNFWVGHRHRTSCRYLFTKNRDYRAVRPQHIPKTGGHESGVARLGGTSPQIQFCNTLRGPHDIAWVYRLVCRHQHKTRHLVGNGQVQYILGSQYIIEHSPLWVLLHHMHMFISSGMKDRVYGLSLK